MDEIMIQNHVEKDPSLVLDIESLAQSSEISLGSPKLTKVLARKSSSRMERKSAEEQGIDGQSKNFIFKFSHIEQLKQILLSNKSTTASSTNIPSHIDSYDSKNRKLHFIIHPSSILLIFATLSSMGTLLLIFFTLTYKRTDGV